MPTRRAGETGALRFYRVALRLYPAEFRSAYGNELCLFFLDRWRHERSASGLARVFFGSAAGVLHEAPKEHGAMMLQDLRYALRLLRQDRLITLAAVAILALGIGAATVVYSFANGLLVRPLPYPSLSSLVAIAETNPRDAGQSKQVSFANSLDLRARSRLLVDMGTYDEGTSTIRDEGDAESVPGSTATDGVFPTLEVAPVLGRTFTRAETVFKGPAVMILGEELWRRRYGADPHILGRQLAVDGKRYAVIGIMPADFHFPYRAQLWLPQQSDPEGVHARTSYFLHAIGRLRPGVSVTQATAELESLLTGIHRMNPATDNGYTIRAEPLREFAVATYRKPVLILLLAVVFLLLIACANVSNLLLVKASTRSREMAVRTAIGATRGRLIRQLLVEGLLLGLLGGALGLGLAAFGTPALLSLIPADLPRWISFSIDQRVFAFALALSLLTSLMFGLAPALSAFDHNVTESLKDGGGGGTRRRQRRLRQGLVIAEVALSFTLLAGAGLMIRSFLVLRAQPLGYQPENAMSLDLDIPPERYPLGAPYRALIGRIGTEVAALPGVTGVAFASGVPLNSDWMRIFTIEGHPLKLEEMPSVHHVVVTSAYFRGLGIPLLQGRTFVDSDWNTPVVVVTRNFARRYWPHEGALGHRLRFGPPTAHESWHTVVGVVADSRHGDLKDTEHGNVYIPANDHFETPNLLVRGTMDPLRMAPAVRSRILGIDRGIAVTDVRSLDQLIDLASWRDRLFAVLFAAFAALALILAAGGLYAALAYAVALQTREIGIRMALGATAQRVRSMVLRQGFSLVLAGLGIGLAAALALTRLIGAQLYGVSAFDPLTYAVAPTVLLMAALVAVTVPTRRATRVDPVEALRRQ